MVSTASKMVKKRPAKAAAARLEARVPAEQKSLFERAAALRGVNLTTFMVDSMREAALKTLEEHELIRLTVAERRRFVDALLNPPEPNEALRSATKRYNRLVAR